MWVGSVTFRLVRTPLGKDGSEYDGFSRLNAVLFADEPISSVQCREHQRFLVLREIRRYNAVHAKIEDIRCEK